MSLLIHHAVVIADARAHLVAVETTVTSSAPLADPLILFMPVWTPGSYLVREYARHVEGLEGFADGAASPASKVRKNAWRVGRKGAREVSVRYLVYANELTVRTNHVDSSHALLNGAALFMTVDGHEDLPAVLDVTLPPGWKLMTALPRASEQPGVSSAEATGSSPVRLLAKDFDALVDSPLELGDFRSDQVEAKGVLHDVATWPKDRFDDGQMATLLRDVGKIIETEAAWFGDVLPYDRYTLLLHLSPRGRGGLEHASGAALISSPTAFGTREGYLDLLSLVSHELFHAWNVKRIRPAALSPYRYQEENYTRLLWWFEGATSYYDWRTLRVSGLCTPDEYLDHLAGEIAVVERVPGRLVQSLEQASFDAWIKLYRPDENSENSSVSYYRKGEVVCALLDLEIRARTEGRATLDLVLSRLWERHGKTGRGVPEDAMQSLFEEATGATLGDLFDAWIRSPGDIDCDRTLAKVGLRLDRESFGAKEGGTEKPARAALGLRLRNEVGRAVVLTVVRGGSAQRAGIDPGDELIAIGGRRVEAGGVDGTLGPLAPGEEVEVLVMRDGRTLTTLARLDPARAEKLRIVPKREAGEAERALGLAWLGR